MKKIKKLKKMYMAFDGNGKPDYNSCKSKAALKHVMGSLYDGGWAYWKDRGWKIRKVWLVVKK